MLQRAGVVSSNLEVSTRAGEFVELARQLVLARGDLVQAAQTALNDRHQNIAAVLKSAVAAGTLSNYSAIAQLPAIATAFLDSLRNVGAFDSMLPSMVRMPLRTRVAISSVAITGTTVAESTAKPISSLTLDSGQLDEKKALALLVVSDELLRAAGSVGSALFARELKRAVAAATDDQFILLITTGLTPITSSGTTAAAIRADLGAALDAIDVHDNSRLFILLNSIVAKRWATKQNEGDLFLQNMTPNGGTIAGMPVIVSDGVDDGTIVVADAAQIAAASEMVTLDVSRQASLQMNSAPLDSPPTSQTILHSLFQTNTVALRAERFFGAEPLGSHAVALIDAVSSV
jgi:HK97 family phage major capsid protein